ncbi:hypothetical protein DPMN_152681 [Dreissena polymorpha]|uniref:Uncharacterized protein n=1 Tax=Dreissena polymorpha TaxID=45954 RepID=A0A9D4FKU8_DREPO|nr:hypothetical protein DPMN_152681 [Dreissena polymorpha]
MDMYIDLFLTLFFRDSHTTSMEPFLTHIASNKGTVINSTHTVFRFIVHNIQQDRNSLALELPRQEDCLIYNFSIGHYSH